MSSTALEKLKGVTNGSTADEEAPTQVYDQMLKQVNDNETKRMINQFFEEQQARRPEAERGSFEKDDTKYAVDRANRERAEQKARVNFKKPPSRKDASAHHSSAPMQLPQQADEEPTITSYQLSCEEKAAGFRGLDWGIDPGHPWNIGNIYQKCLSTIYGEGHPKGRIDMQDCYNDKGKVELNPLCDASMGIDRLQTPRYFGFGTPPANVVHMPLWRVEDSAVWMRRMVAEQEGAYILRYDEREAAFNPTKRRRVLLLNNPKDVCFDAIATWERAANLLAAKTNDPMGNYYPIVSTIQPLGYGFGCGFETTWRKGQKRTIDDHASKFTQGLFEAREHEAAAAAAAPAPVPPPVGSTAAKAATDALFANLEEKEAEAEAEEAKKEKKKDKMRVQKGGDYAFTQPVDPESKNIADRNGTEAEMQHSRYLYASNR